MKIKKNLTHWLSVIVIGIILGVSLQFVRAWTEPTQAPPNGNLGAPINTSATAQTKAGGITAGTLTAATVTGTTQLCIGTDCRNAWPSGTTPTPTPTPTCMGGSYDIVTDSVCIVPHFFTHDCSCPANCTAVYNHFYPYPWGEMTLPANVYYCQ